MCNICKTKKLHHSFSDMNLLKNVIPTIKKNSTVFFSKSNTKKKRVLVLGSGWSSYSVLKNINRSLFDVKVVAPRNHFLFTPLLCSTAVGTLEFRLDFEDLHSFVSVF